nr:hypothetical protein [Oxynema sp. CENA135]
MKPKAFDSMALTWIPVLSSWGVPWGMIRAIGSTQPISSLIPATIRQYFIFYTRIVATAFSLSHISMAVSHAVSRYFLLSAECKLNNKFVNLWISFLGE